MMRTRPLIANSTRGGSLLVEVMIAMTVGSVVLTLGIGMLHLLLRSESAMTDSLQRGQTVSQLSRMFRQDVHAARSANIETPAKNDPQSKPELKLQLAPDHQVQYAALDDAVLRTETQAGKTLHNVRFRFTQGSVIDFSKDPESPERVSLIINSPKPKLTRIRPHEPAGVLRELKIEANLGRDHRFESNTKPSE